MVKNEPNRELHRTGASFLNIGLLDYNSRLLYNKEIKGREDTN